MRIHRPSRRTALIGALVLSLAAFGVVVPLGAGASGPPRTSFSLFVNPSSSRCLQQPGSSKPPSVTATVVRGDLNDRLSLQLQHFKPGLAFDLFTVQRSNQLADGSPDPDFVNVFNKSFGLAWYQSDIQVNDNGSGSVVIRTILLDQIFGFDPDVSLAPTNTFHVGFWFNDPADAASCGFTGSTPFNGEHQAGPLAFITRPDATTGLGPLCTDPNTSTSPATCNP